MAFSKELVDAVDKTDAIVADFDGTLCRGNFIRALCFQQLRRARQEHDYTGLFRGALDAAKISLMLKPLKGKEAHDAKGVQLAYQALARLNLDRDDIRKYAIKYVLENAIPETQKLLVRFASKPKFLATLQGSTMAQVAAAHFDLNGGVSNVELFDKRDRLHGINIVMSNAQQKFELSSGQLRSQGIALEKCAVVGDGLCDKKLLEKALVSIAPTSAVPEILNVAKFHMEVSRNPS